MDEKPEENGQFKLRLDKLDEEIDERAIPAEINEMRLEKISQRVTLISIMIPVLIVIVLVIAYLDIKKRVVQTEDSGTFEFQKLSADLESRFSSLSVRQAKIEEALESFTAKNDHALAAIQVRMEKLQDAIGEVRRGALGQKELNAVKEDLAKQVKSVSDAADQAARQTVATLQEVKGQVVQQGETLTAAKAGIAELQKGVEDIDARKIDKQSLDLALRLETLKIETRVKTQIDALQDKLRDLERKVSQGGAQAAPVPPPPAPPAPATPRQTSGAPSENAGRSDSEIETETITR
jgi:uncharacterized coiled-coil protein SlyX